MLLLASTSPLPPALPSDSPEIHGHARNGEANHNQRLHRVCNDRPTQQEQTDAAEDDRCSDPSAVGTFEKRLANTQNDETKHRSEVKGIASDAIEGEKRGELADDNVKYCEPSVEQHGIDWGEKEAGVFVGNEGMHCSFKAAATSAAWTVETNCGAVTDTHLAEDAR